MLTPTVPSADRHPHYRALDGLRGLAIAGIFYFHVGTLQKEFAPEGSALALRLTFARFGWIGVDLFFVLSGFLITSILLRARGASNFFRTFYVRRVLRLAPLYYGMVLVVFTSHWFTHRMPAYPWTTQIWFWFNMSNLPNAFEHAVVQPLGPFWTLAIEEQFYLVWPLLVLWLRPRTLLRVAISTVVVEALLRMVPFVHSWNLVYREALDYRLPMLHSEGLFAGAALALVLAKGPVSAQNLQRIRLLTLPLCIAAFLSIRSDLVSGLVRDLRFTLLSLAFTAVVALLVLEKPSNWLPATFTVAPLRLLGRYSYCMYVIHAPLLLLGKHLLYPYASSRPVLGAEFLLTFVACFAIAALSWRFLEEPLLALKRHFPYARPQTEVGTLSAYRLAPEPPSGT